METRGSALDLNQAAAAYAEQLPQVLWYLEKRGISEDLARRFELGFVGSPMMGDESYEGRLAIPYRTPAGVIDIRFRRVDDRPDRKYLSRDGATSHLYNVEGLHSARSLVAITEGELDCITLSGLGIPAVGAPGAESWQKHWGRLFDGFQRILVFADGDEAGRSLSGQLAKSLRNVIKMPVPEGYDVNKLFLDPGYGPDWILEKVNG